MPFTLVLRHHAAPRREHPAPPRRASSLAVVAAAAVPAFVTLWLGIFRDVRQALSPSALVAALQASHLLDARALLDTTWWEHGDGPARALLGVLALETVTDAAEAVTETVADLVGAPVEFRATLPEVEQDITTYIGNQLRLIGVTTLSTVHRVLGAGWQAADPPLQVARALRATFGLTPRQQRRLEGLATQLLASGQGRRHVTQTVALATQQALRQRAEGIAQTQSWTLAQMGERLLWSQAVRTGAVAGDRVRRYWQVAGTERTCPRCLAIPGLNPQGVGVDEPFQVPGGSVWAPTLHTRCRCSVGYRVG